MVTLADDEIEALDAEASRRGLSRSRTVGRLAAETALQKCPDETMSTVPYRGVFLVAGLGRIGTASHCKPRLMELKTLVQVEGYMPDPLYAVSGCELPVLLPFRVRVYLDAADCVAAELAHSPEVSHLMPQRLSALVMRLMADIAPPAQDDRRMAEKKAAECSEAVRAWYRKFDQMNIL